VADKPISWSNYLEDVVKFDRIQLLTLAANADCQYRLQQMQADIGGRQWANRSPMQPFSLAAVARDAILSGFDASALTPRTSDLVRLCDKYLNPRIRCFEPAAPTAASAGS
jgi:hypothetical protein